MAFEITFGPAGSPQTFTNRSFEKQAYADEDTGLPAALAKMMGYIGDAFLAYGSGTLIVGSGTKTITIDLGRPWTSGMSMVLTNASDAAVTITGSITAYDRSGTGIMSIAASSSTGSGTLAGWHAAMAGTGVPGPTGASWAGGSITADTYMTGAAFEVAGGTLTAGSNLDIGTSGTNGVANFFTVSGSATISLFGSAQSGARRAFLALSTLTFTHNSAVMTSTAGLFLYGSNLVVSALSVLGFQSLGDSRWKLDTYVPPTGNLRAVEQDTAPTLGGPLSAADLVITRPVFKDYGETLNAIGNSSATCTLDLETANAFSVTLNANCTFTFSNPAATGVHCSFILYLLNDATPSRTTTWPAAVKWPGGSQPSRSSDASDMNIYTFFTKDAGTTWYGSLAVRDPS